MCTRISIKYYPIPDPSSADWGILRLFIFAGEEKIFENKGFAQFFRLFILFLWGFMVILAVHFDDNYLDGNRLQTLMVYFSYTIAPGSLTLCM